LTFTQLFSVAEPVARSRAAVINCRSCGQEGGVCARRKNRQALFQYTYLSDQFSDATNARDGVFQPKSVLFRPMLLWMPACRTNSSGFGLKTV